MKTVTIKDYLTQKGVEYKEHNGELITKCIFNDCDKDSRPNEAHLYFSAETSQYHCKKCDAQGNLTTLKKHFGDTPKKNYRNSRFSAELVHKCHNQLPERIRTYLNERGINDDIINAYKLGYGAFYGKNFITIPVWDEDGYHFFKLRQDPQDGNDKITYPSGKQSQLYGMYAPTGKSYIALEVAKLFPNTDVIKLGRCSRTAFFHEQGKYDKENNQIIIDFSRKILIFTDMPHTGLLEELRSFLSHDDKITLSKITDKGSKGGNRTKTVALIGYPSVVFCSAGLRMDEQEMTRFILLSPEINQDKIRAGISNTVQKEVDNDGYTKWLESNPDRMSLKLRIQAIKQEKIEEIKIENEESILEYFLGDTGSKKVQPRHQRDIKRLLSIIKSFALLNLWWRKREGSSITANEEDIQNAIALWDRISQSQEYNLPPYIYGLYKKVIVPLWQEKQARVGKSGASGAYFGIARQELLQKHYEVYNRMLDSHQLRQQILPMLETAGLIVQESSNYDKRKRLIFPAGYRKKNSENEGEVKKEAQSN